jgi:hypothetical protein
LISVQLDDGGLNYMPWLQAVYQTAASLDTEHGAAGLLAEVMAAPEFLALFPDGPPMFPHPGPVPVTAAALATFTYTAKIHAAHHRNVAVLKTALVNSLGENNGKLVAGNGLLGMAPHSPLAIMTRMAEVHGGGSPQVIAHYERLAHQIFDPRQRSIQLHTKLLQDASRHIGGIFGQSTADRDMYQNLRDSVTNQPRIVALLVHFDLLYPQEVQRTLLRLQTFLHDHVPNMLLQASGTFVGAATDSTMSAATASTSDTALVNAVVAALDARQPAAARPKQDVPNAKRLPLPDGVSYCHTHGYNVSKAGHTSATCVHPAPAHKTTAQAHKRLPNGTADGSYKNFGLWK